MNERIRELLYEAGGEYGGEHPTTGQTVIYTDEVDYAKFAELIVRECAKVAGKYIHENKYTENGVSDFWLTETIKDHFGVQ